MANIDLESHVLCSVCWEDVSGVCGRTVVALQCSHLFHLDCIGSAFNASGCMRCPNCRQVENGNWWGFRNDDPEINIDEIGYYVDVVDTDIHSSGEMEPLYNHSSRTGRGLSELYVLGANADQVMGEEPGRISSNPNFNGYMIDPRIAGEIAASHVIQDHHHLVPTAHQSILNPWQMSAQAVPWYSPRTVPVMLNQDLVSRQAIFNAMFGIQSTVMPSGGSLSFGNGALIYSSYTRPLSSNISPSPVLHDMQAERNTTNGLNGWSQAANPVPFHERTAGFDHVYSATASPESDQGLYNDSPPNCHCHCVNPFM